MMIGCEWISVLSHYGLRWWAIIDLAVRAAPAEDAEDSTKRLAGTA
jgi:hypothetical protein